mgnify:CR=1 FL=1
MRILVWGFSNNLAGTEAVVSNYIGRINRIAFDVVSYEETPSYAPLFTGSNNLIVIPRKSSSPCGTSGRSIAFSGKLQLHMTEYGATLIPMPTSIV